MVDIHLAAGDEIYVGGTVTSLFGGDISADTYLIALNSSPITPPIDTDPAWVTPTVTSQGDTLSERIVLLLVQPPVASGRYFVWVRVADNPENVSGCVQRNVNVYN